MVPSSAKSSTAKKGLDRRVIWLEAVYEVQAGDYSFTALIRGGTGETTAGEPASVSGAALLDGVILSGWLTTCSTW